MNGEGTYETFGKEGKKMSGTWLNNVLMKTDDKTNVGFKSTLPTLKPVKIILTPTV
jgi:hypothetical protein